MPCKPGQEEVYCKLDRRLMVEKVMMNAGSEGPSKILFDVEDAVAKALKGDNGDNKDDQSDAQADS